MSGLRSRWTLSGDKVRVTETVDVSHGVEELPEEGQDFEFADFGCGVVLERAAVAELEEAVESFGVFFVAVVAHDVGVSDFGEVFHDEDFPFVVGVLLELFLFDELDGDDSVFGEVVALVDRAKVALAQGLGLVDVEVLVDFLHSFHLLFIQF